MKLLPCGHRVLVRLEEVEEESKGGIILAREITQRDKYATTKAHVVHIGSNAFKDFGDGHAWCKVGDLVMIAKYAGENQEDIEPGQVFRIINDEDIIAVWSE